MPNRTRDAGAVCPFYMSSEKNMISCECAIGGTRLWHAFSSCREAENHWLNFCCSYCYLGCPYAQMLIGLYEDGEGKSK